MSDMDSGATLTEAKLAELTAAIVSAYVSNNSLPAGELPSIIKGVSASFERQRPAQEPEEITPAVSVRRSIAPDHLVCLVCGKNQKTLKRHLSSAHGMSPADYRTMFGLASDYPMVASQYAQARSEMAKRIGLGQKGRGMPSEPPKAAPKKTRKSASPSKATEAAAAE